MMVLKEVDIKVECGCCELRENIAFADLAYKNFTEIKPPEYTKEELEYAKKAGYS